MDLICASLDLFAAAIIGVLLDIKSTIGEGTTAIIRIPREKVPLC
ncbi:MAG: hypothetical protein RSD55_04790 [Lachnospiraceae bacterium]